MKINAKEVVSEMSKSKEHYFENIDVELKEPSMYKVLLLNDDYTPMDFVVSILMRYFNKDKAMAKKIMLNVHRQGKGLCGIYTYEIAETKSTLVQTEARENQYPLRCIMEEE